MSLGVNTLPLLYFIQSFCDSFFLLGYSCLLLIHFANSAITLLSFPSYARANQPESWWLVRRQNEPRKGPDWSARSTCNYFPFTSASSDVNRGSYTAHGHTWHVKIMFCLVFYFASCQILPQKRQSRHQLKQMVNNLLCAKLKTIPLYILFLSDPFYTSLLNTPQGLSISYRHLPKALRGPQNNTQSRVTDTERSRNKQVTCPHFSIYHPLHINQLIM